jgi:phosphatidylinositol alpha-mannosyltransferase
LTKPLLRSLARHIDLTTAVSEAAASTIHRAVGIDAEVLFNGFETERFREKPRTRSDEIVFVTVGRLEERKGTGVAIRAVLDHNAVSSEPWRLIIIGDGPQRPRLEAIAAGSNKIRFVGALSDADKREWLRRAHALIAPSTRGESFGLVLLEAMASETRVVASDIPGYRDAAGEHALLFEPANDVSLQAALATAISSETPAAIEAARLYAEHWSMQRLMDRYENLYVAAHVRFAEPR